MKKIIFTLITLCFALNSFAQEHLKFKGIPIEGSITSFCEKLKSKGLEQVETDNNATFFVGDFTGRNATIGVAATDDGKNVYSVAVCFDPSKEWNTLVNTYDYYIKSGIIINLCLLYIYNNFYIDLDKIKID